jgi:hypothetical protein
VRYSERSVVIIAREHERTPAGAGRSIEYGLAAAAVMVALGAWIVYQREGLVLSHYDAKAHLVVARRVIDSLTPGWRQLGAVWLPLPHLLQILPTQIDVLYRTGAFGSFISIACFGVAAWATARLVLVATRSRLAAATATLLLVLNPNLVYVHATPMTEPLLIAATLVSVLWLYEWLADQPERESPAKIGWILFAAAWTRYEAWPIVASAIAATGIVLWSRGMTPHGIASQLWRLARWPITAVVLFLVNSRLTVGAWLVSSGFFVPDPTYDGKAAKTLLSIWWGTHRLGGYVIEITALATAAFVIARALLRRADSALLVTVALLAAAALPSFAFYEGHPFRIRYMLPLAFACIPLCGLAVGRQSRPARRALLAAVLIASALFESPPWNADAPLLVESQLDASNSAGRQQVTACLSQRYHGEKVLASMGSLAHYMQELSHDGFMLTDFIHEGNGVLWDMALETGPAPLAGWMLVEEQAEGGDVLAERVRRDPAFTTKMMRICEGGGVALYERH